jgi:release factor glutamine methyltransferase
MTGSSSSDRTQEAKDGLETGIVKFLGVPLLVEGGVLVPRVETELLGQKAIDVLAAKNGEAQVVIDMCCGAGNLACAIATKVENVRVWGSDLTDECVQLARKNVEYCQVGDIVTIVQGDLFEPLEETGIKGAVDVIVCNPPYIPEKTLHGDLSDLLELEPIEAFEAGPYGISFHQRVSNAAASWLRVGGTLLFEFGVGQERHVEAIIKRARVFGEVELFCNEEGEPRVALARRIK